MALNFGVAGKFAWTVLELTCRIWPTFVARVDVI